MAGKLSQAGDLAALNAALGLSPSASRYLALATSAPTDSALGSEVTTPGSSGYARQAIAFSTPAVQGDGSTLASNSAVLTFGPFGAPMAQVTHVMLMDASTGGDATHMTAWAALDNARTPASGDSIQFAIGAVSWAVN